MKNVDNTLQGNLLSLFVMVDAQVNSEVGSIVHGNKSGGVNDSVFESLHGLIVFFCPEERLPFACEVD